MCAELHTQCGSRRIAVTGASGLVGRRLCAFLSGGGHRVEPLVRREPRAGSPEIRWDPAHGQIDAARLEGVDAVVHLAGENVAGRWTAARKKAILQSRVEGTTLLSQALAGLSKRPRVLVSASGIGYYGNRGDQSVDEQSPPGNGFLSEVCQQWEAGTEAAAKAGIRVVNLRLGMVLAAEGGALAYMLTPYRLGLGGRIGPGTQLVSWIALDDLVGCIHHLIVHDEVQGPVNAVAPQSVCNAELVRTLGRVLHRPTLFPKPAWLIRAVVGEMGQALLLDGARVQPTRLQASGFKFLYPDLESALRYELGL